MITAIIGANYGDEGKGLAVNYFSRNGNCVVVRHNGGAQSGHTVELEDGKKFIFHELSSGSFNDAVTFWASTYHPDLYILGNELNNYYKVANKIPRIYADPNVNIAIIDDVILNCFKETQSKNGSCGMGIWECVCRVNAGYTLTIQQIKDMTLSQLVAKLSDIRTSYTIPRLKVFQETYGNNDFAEKLMNDDIIKNYAAEIKHNVGYVRIVENTRSFFDTFDDIVYESGQGLLIDGEYDKIHGTPSRTGLYNVKNHLSSVGLSLDNAVYVTRTYLTRHGRGDFVEECDAITADATNVWNQWQEGLRYGRFTNIKSLAERIYADSMGYTPQLFVTHANVTRGNILTTDGETPIDRLPFDKIYISKNKYGVNVCI